VDEANLALLVLRVGAGLTLAAHGYAKFFRGGRIAGTARWFDSIGMRPGRINAYAAACGEIASGICLAAGLLTTFAGLGFVGLMTVAAITAHVKNGFFILKEGWEYVFILGLIGVTVATLGPGEWSIDNALGIADDLDGYTGLIISAGGGLAAAFSLLAAVYRPPKPAT
jgi:putative oxidoreductase